MAPMSRKAIQRASLKKLVDRLYEIGDKKKDRVNAERYWIFARVIELMDEECSNLNGRLRCIENLLYEEQD